MLSKSQSQRIAVLRPVLIALIVITHMPGNLYRPDNREIELSLLNTVNVFFSGTLSMVAMPILSVISGYLIVESLSRRNYQAVIYNKVKKLLVPMLFWSLVMAFYVYIKQEQGYPARPDLELYPFDIKNWLTSVFAISKLPPNPPLYFLRELFIACLVAPLFVYVARHKLLSVSLFVFLLYSMVLQKNYGIFFRIDIYLFFFMGVLVNSYGLIDKIEDWLSSFGRRVTVFYLIAIALIVSYVFSSNGDYFIVFVKLITLPGPFVFWYLSKTLVEKGLAMFFVLLSPASFTVFLSHAAFIPFTWELWVEIFKASPYNFHFRVYWVMLFIAIFIGGWLLCYSYNYLKRKLRLAS